MASGEKREDCRGEGREREVVYVQPGYMEEHQDDEIDLVDLFGVLIRRWPYILLSVLIVTAAAVGYGFMQTPRYKASTTIEVGQRVVDGEYVNIESVSAVKSRILSLASSKSRDFEGKGREGKLLFSPRKDVSVNVPEDGNILQVFLTAPKDSTAKDFLNSVNKDLVAAHDRIIALIKEGLRSSIERENMSIERVNLKIEEIRRQFDIKKLNTENRIQQIKNNIEKNLNNKIAQTKREYKLDKLQLQNKIQKINNQIDDLQNRKKSLHKKEELLTQQKNAIQQQIVQKEKIKESLNSANFDATRQANTDSASGLMLFSSERWKIEQQIQNLRNQAVFDIPQQMIQVQNQVNEIESKIKSQKAELEESKTNFKQLDEEFQSKLDRDQAKLEDEKAKLEEAKINLKQLDSELKSKIADLKSKIKDHNLKIDTLQSRLKNMIVTSVIDKPEFSRNPVSPNRKMFFALGFVLGIFLGIFAAFLREFWVNNKSRLMGKA
jgi:capsular polysaccharide biosynthesis protein